MNINILGNDNKIEFEENYVNIIRVYDVKYFTNLVLTINRLCNGDSIETNFITLHGDNNEILNFDKEAQIILDIFNIELNSKKILTKLYDKIELESNNLDSITEELIVLRKLIYDNLDEFNFNFKVSSEVSIQQLLKVFDVKIDEYMYLEVKEKLYFLIDIITELKTANIIIIPNLKLYFDEYELIEIYKYVLYKDIKLVIIERESNNKVLKYEKILEIDENFDDFIIK